MQKDTWIIIGFMVTLVGLLATFMVISLTSIESRLTAMDNRLAAMDNRLAAIDGRLAAMDGRLHEMSTRLGRIEGHLRLPTDIEPIRFETMDEVIIFKEDDRQVLGPACRQSKAAALPSVLDRTMVSPPSRLVSRPRASRHRSRSA